MRSLSTTSRKVLSGLLLVFGFGFTVAVKLTRGTDASFVPDDIAGVLPNLMCGALVPVVIFIGTRDITARDYLLFVALILCSLVVYDVTQLWMPRRTFAFDDIWASAVGSAIAVALGFALFLRPRRI
jgi:hypothetical protein